MGAANIKRGGRIPGRMRPGEREPLRPARTEALGSPDPNSSMRRRPGGALRRLPSEGAGSRPAPRAQPQFAFSPNARDPSFRLKAASTSTTSR